MLTLRKFFGSSRLALISFPLASSPFADLRVVCRFRLGAGAAKQSLGCVLCCNQTAERRRWLWANTNPTYLRRLSLSVRERGHQTLFVKRFERHRNDPVLTAKPLRFCLPNIS